MKDEAGVVGEGKAKEEEDDVAEKDNEEPATVEVDEERGEDGKEKEEVCMVDVLFSGKRKDDWLDWARGEGKGVDFRDVVLSELLARVSILNAAAARETERVNVNAQLIYMTCRCQGAGSEVLGENENAGRG